MRFAQGSGRELGLFDAALTRFPDWDGRYAPSGDADLRQAIYAPESSYVDAATLAIAELFQDEADPFVARRLAESSFFAEPPRRAVGEDILAIDLADGPSASAADQGAAFLAAVAAQEARRGLRVTLLADGSGSEGAALSEAVAGARGVDLALLYPEGAHVSGVRLARLCREGGNTLLIGTRADSDGVGSMIRSLAGAAFDDRVIADAGRGNPARFASRLVGLTAAFALLRSGTAGELYIGLRAGDQLDLAAGLWAWRLGIPITGFIVPRPQSEPDGARWDSGRWNDPAGAEIIDRFEREMPGAIRSLVLPIDVDAGAVESARGFMDRDSAAILAAAQ
ncbi:MAG: hypothetical protein Q8M76_04860, partial [Spirochaetaceae bacterium]|nr:hypothetical protein [Spirochaetaceae bacterium]